MTAEITLTQNTGLDLSERLILAGQAANGAAAQHVFTDFQQRKASNTLNRQNHDLKCFADYLAAAGVEGDAGWVDSEGTCILFSTPAEWRGVTWGIVAGFVQWQLQQGFAIGSINVRLSTVKTYAKLAAQVGSIDPTEYAMIHAVSGYRQGEARNVDKGRAQTRYSTKKAIATKLTSESVKRLKSIGSETAQGRRDKVIVMLMLGLGLRVGEVVSLRVEAVDLAGQTITFHREKVDKIQTHELTNGTLAALRNYFDAGDVLPSPNAPLLRKSSKSEKLSTGGLTRFGIFKVIERLGSDAGIAQLSPHDLRHYWATQAARNKTPLDRLMNAGGWSSPAMPLHYIEDAEIANQGVISDDD